LVLVSTVPPRSLIDVPCPILLVFGERETSPIPALPHVHGVIINDAGHDPHLEAPEAFVAALARNGV
jgi:pimeloyl-ACP methyl ester carboxylesterase